MASARQIRSETTGKWMFKSTRVVGLDEFTASWRTAAVRDVQFDHSGYVLGNYLDAQDAVNHAQIFDEQSDDATALAKAFTAAFPFEQPVPLPDLAPAPLAAFCREEYGRGCGRHGGRDSDGASLLSTRLCRDHSRTSGRLPD
jgi:hypothetical protein